MDRSPDAAPDGAAVAVYLDSRRRQILRDFREELAGTRPQDENSSRSASDQSRIVNAVVDDMVATLREFPASRISASITDRSDRAPFSASGGAEGGREGDGRLASALAVLFKVVLLLVIGGISGDADGAGVADFCAFSAIALNRSILVRSQELSGRPGGAPPEAVAEHEYRRLVRDLHDRVGNDIAAAIAALEGADTDAGRARAATLMRTALTNVRSTIGTLRSAPLTLDLHTSLCEYLEVDGSHDAAVQVRMTGDQATVPARTRDELFLIVREAVRNAIRHAHAAAITVDITIGADEVHVIVADDGVGLGDARARGATGGGLVTMRERAESLGGVVAITGGPGEGTTVDIRVPLMGRSG